MINRIRDAKRYLRPQSVISYEGWQTVLERHRFATNFLKETNPIYVTMKADMEETRDLLLENKVLETREENFVTETFKKVFILPRQIQVDELVGKYKYIKSILDELQYWIDDKKNKEKDEAEGKVVIRRTNE